MIELILFKVVTRRRLDHIFNVHLGRVNYLLRELLRLSLGANVDQVDLHIVDHFV